ncbi:hypothetical protein LFM09_12940 [Lentzea alba]|uniref:hypothetical protein n=1 Tax=Lentzea alba TaxID=2714351 RepID=UPI0039BFEFD5
MAGPVKAPPVEVPKLINISRWLWIASALVTMVGFVAQLFDRETIIAEVRRANPALGQDQIDAGVNGSILFVLLMSTAILLAYVRLANAMARGRNWARIVLAVIGVLSVVFGLFRLVAWASGVAAAFGVEIRPIALAVAAVTTVLEVIAFVLMFRVSAHFRKRVTVDSTFLRS